MMKHVIVGKSRTKGDGNGDVDVLVDSARGQDHTTWRHLCSYYPADHRIPRPIFEIWSVSQGD